MMFAPGPSPIRTSPPEASAIRLTMSRPKPLDSPVEEPRSKTLRNYERLSQICAFLNPPVE